MPNYNTTKHNPAIITKTSHMLPSAALQSHIHTPLFLSFSTHRFNTVLYTHKTQWSYHSFSQVENSQWRPQLLFTAICKTHIITVQSSVNTAAKRGQYCHREQADKKAERGTETDQAEREREILVGQQSQTGLLLFALATSQIFSTTWTFFSTINTDVVAARVKYMLLQKLNWRALIYIYCVQEYKTLFVLCLISKCRLNKGSAALWC